MIVADFIAEALVGAGVQHTFGVGGANIEDLFAAIQRRRPALRAVLGKHEHAAATAADAYARLTGGVGVVMATSGGGTMNLVHGLAEARASRVPLLAIVGEPPSDVQGQGAFQDTSGRSGALARCLRITVGTAVENERCLRALRSALSSEHQQPRATHGERR